MQKPSSGDTLQDRVADGDRYSELRRAIAAGPTKGPWTAMYKGAGQHCVAVINKHEVVPPASVELSNEKLDARYIAAADPDTIAALLKERDALLEEGEASE